MKKGKKKLTFRRETLRRLADLSLERAAGGDTVYTLCFPCEETDYSCNVGFEGI